MTPSLSPCGSGFRVLKSQPCGDGAPPILPPVAEPAAPETAEKRARRLFDEMARNIGRNAVNHMKQMYPGVFVGQPTTAELSMVNTIRNDINYRMRPLLMAMIQMHKDWDAELEADQ